ncbi:MAG TPA: thiamine phosphate synthase [Candidatus Limnocylindrales bacterium]|nr:thiamine phosphate synthase [Candidatus Limnocylindrales bacterium]
MKLPRVYPILDSVTVDARGLRFEAAAAALIDGGAQILQIRHKALWDRDFFAISQTVARLCAESGVTLIVNDRADFAMLLNAGLHIGQDDLSPRDARRILGSDAIVGFSSHNPQQLCAAGGEPVDYVAFGPVFPTASKNNPDPVVGVAEVARCRGLVEKPLVAIGGITLENAAGVWKAGADSVAVIGGLFPGTSSAQTLRRRMEEWQQLAASL